MPSGVVVTNGISIHKNMQLFSLLSILLLSSLLPASSASPSDSRLRRKPVASDELANHNNDNIDIDKSIVDTQPGRHLQTTGKQQQEALDQARNQWSFTSWNMPMNYTYRLKESDSDDTNTNIIPLYVDVRDGRVTNVQPEFLFDDGMAMYDPLNYYTVDEYFALIQRALVTSEENNPGALTANATYDERYGYPTSIRLDERASGGSEIVYEISEVVLYTVLQRDLDRYQRNWIELEATDYDYEIQAICFCTENFLRPQLIQVRDGAIVSVTDATTGGPSAYFDAFPTVDEIFDGLQNGIAGFAHFVNAEYDNVYSYPLTANVNANRQIADAGTFYRINYLDIRRFTPEQEALDAAMELWDTQGLTRYVIGYQNRCFCSPEYTARLLIDVREGVVTGVRKRDERNGSVLAEVAESVPTVDGIFDTIQQGINLNAPVVSVEYDPIYGYPTSMYIDYSELIADEEASLVVDFLAPVSAWQTALDDAKLKWEESSIDSYVYTFRRSCECLDSETEPKEITVTGNVVTAIDGVAPPTTMTNSRIPTLFGMFDIIQAGIDANAVRVDVEYDSVYGYPLSVFIDYDENTADEEDNFFATLSEESITDPPDPGPGRGPRNPFFCRGSTAMWFPRLCSV